HHGDFFGPLALYRECLAEKGILAPEPVPANYEPAWCSWGYEFDVKPDEMIGVLPALHEMGIRWLTLDDRWFDAYGDWNPRGKTFPGGVANIRRMNEAIHAAGAFSQVWWYPLCAEDGHGRWESHRYGVSQLLKEHPDWVILNADGSVARNNRHLAMLCPALPEVQEYTRTLTTRFIEWGFDGHKLDNIYPTPPCHNPAHHHACPEDATAAMADVYRIIFETTRALRPNSVTQICPCGTPLTHHLLPATDQTVTADPTSSAQIRQRLKFYKALTGPCAAVFADHVELSDGGTDFASGIGAGGVPSTKFIWPDDEGVKARLKEVWNLPPEKQAAWQKWFHLYNTHRPAEGEYLNLYDLAFDFPETHAIQKNGRMYYAFFFAESFEGRVELRGLSGREYRVTDYVNEKDLGVVRGEAATLDLAFEGALLLVAEVI
ncbi:MAG TPA: alpha-galactosidase, partial [Anaerolineales bacterium]|nr:alpha-galactosidase [Anaerolineales bacterium]